MSLMCINRHTWVSAMSIKPSCILYSNIFFSIAEDKFTIDRTFRVSVPHQNTTAERARIFHHGSADSNEISNLSINY